MADKGNQPGSQAEMVAAVGAAVAAIGLLLIQLFVEPERLHGWTVPHMANIALVALAVVSALIIAVKELGKIKRKKADRDKV